MSNKTLRSALLATLLLLASLPLHAFQPPVARKEAKIDTLFGHVMVDNYYWLRDESRSRPDVIGYLEAENAYTDSVMEHTLPLQKTLYDEMVGRLKQTDQSVPVKRDDYYYYTRTDEGKQYKIYCRKHGSLEAPEEVLLDVNQLAGNLAYMDIGIFEVSPDHATLAFAADTVGNERYVLRFMDIASRRIYPEAIDSVSTSLAWANDNKTVFYVATDEAWRAYEALRHSLGEPPRTDQVVYYEADATFEVDVERSKSRQYIFLTSSSETSSECRFLDADEAYGELRLVEPRAADREYSVYNQDGYFYIVTNDGAIDFRLVRAPVDMPSRPNWTEIIGPRYAVKLDRLDVFKDYIVLYERERGLRQIRVWDLGRGDIRRIEFPEEAYLVYGGENPEYDSEWLRFKYESLVTPESVYDYNMRTGERVLRKQEEVIGYDPAGYETKRIYVPVADSVEVPVSLVWKKIPPREAPRPLYLYGYGAYGISMDPYFNPTRVSMLDRGFIFAIAHVRGGGELGRRWYYAGRLLEKKNTFTDFIAVAEYLIKEKYTTRDDLVIAGGSAGGLLIGAVLDMRPDLCKVAVADVPFVDIMNTMLDETIPLTTAEYSEWGNPNEKPYFEYMLSYSPYDNVKASRYPDMLVTASLYDTRVAYWEPAKWVAKLRATRTRGGVILLKTDMGAGHGGASGRYSAIEQVAFEYAFILDMLGLSR